MYLLIHGPQSLAPRPGRNKALACHYRALFEQPQNKPNPLTLSREVENAVKFLRHQREYKVGCLTCCSMTGHAERENGIMKVLLERYNPLIDLTAEERIEATARRVGLNMPETAKSDSMTTSHLSCNTPTTQPEREYVISH